MAGLVWGKAIPPRLSLMAMTLIERDSSRPCPVSDRVWAMVVCDQGSAQICWWARGWLVLITAM